MTELLIVATGEVIEAMTETEAREITRRINSDLDGIASHYESVMPLIREALTRQAWAALGYNGPSDYIAAEFDGSMRGLPREVRQVVVSELSAAGMSTRAIAPVVGVSHTQVRHDAGGNNFPPEPEPDRETETDPLAGWSTSATEALTKTTVTQTTKTVTEPITPVIGIDGKEYKRPEPTAPRRKPITETFWKQRYDLMKRTESLQRLTQDDRFTQNKQKVAEENLNDLMRCRDLLQQVIDELTTSQHEG